MATPVALYVDEWIREILEEGPVDWDEIDRVVEELWQTDLYVDEVQDNQVEVVL